MSDGYLERIIPHEMWCAMYDQYPKHSGKPCNCPVKIVRELEAENQRLQAELDKAQEINIFAAAFADKVQEFGTIPRLIEAYSASKMESRRLEQELKAAKLAHERTLNNIGNLLARIFCDGGHHAFAVGTDLAIQQAEASVSAWLTMQDEFQQLKQSHEQYREWAAGQMEQARATLETARLKMDLWVGDLEGIEADPVKGDPNTTVRLVIKSIYRQIEIMTAKKS